MRQSAGVQPERKIKDRVRLSEDRARELGTRLRTIRTGAGLTQRQVAERAGVTPEHLQTLEGGTGNPTVASLYALADALGIEVKDLLP